MKKVFTVVVLTVLLALVTVMPGFAQSTTKSLSTNFTVVNLGTGALTGQVQYLKPDGTAWGDGTEAFTISQPGGQAIFRQYYPAGEPGNPNLTTGAGSAIVSASEPMGAVAQIQARGQNPTSMGAYSAFAELDSAFSIPLVARKLPTASGTGNSQIVVQNAGDSAVNVDIDFISSSGSIVYTKSITGLEPGASYYYDLALESASNISDAWIGSAVVRTTTGTLAVVTNFFTGDAMQTFNGFPASAPTTTWYVPLFTSRLPNSLSTPLAVQNLSGSAIATGDIVVTCMPDPGTTGFSVFTMTNPLEVGNTAAVYFNPVVDMSIPTGFLGSCKVEASANVVSFVQMRFLAVGEAAAYEAIPGGGTDTNVFIPLVAKRLPNGFATAVTIQNMSSVTATVDLTYLRSAESSVGDPVVNIDNVEIGPNASLIQNHRVTSGSQAVPQLPDGWSGTLRVESDQPVDAFVQLTFLRSVNPGLPGGDNFMAHNAFTVAAP